VHNISKEEIKQKAAENDKKKTKESLRHEVSLEAAGEPLSQQTVERERDEANPSSSLDGRGISLHSLIKCLAAACTTIHYSDGRNELLAALCW
jgi:hypothetical protein